MNKSNCPICASDSGRTVRTKADIVQCEKCGVTYLRTRPEVEELERMYQSYASNPGSHMKLPETVQQIKTSGLRRDDFFAQVVKHTGEPKGQLLDIGCGWGAFLHNCRDHGFSVQGVEICKQMADFGWGVMGVPIQSKQVEKCDLKEGAFRVVTMLHSLEHMPNQQQTLNLIHRLLEQDGFFCGIVPNFDSLCSRSMGDAWPWLDPNFHYCHFTPETLGKALWMFGFNVHAMFTTTGDFDRNILAKYVRGPKLDMPKHEVDAAIAHLELSGQGEEIRWFAQRI